MESTVPLQPLLSVSTCYRIHQAGQVILEPLKKCELESVCDVSLSSFSPQFPEQADMQVNTVFETGKTYLPLGSWFIVLTSPSSWSACPLHWGTCPVPWIHLSSCPVIQTAHHLVSSLSGPCPSLPWSSIPECVGAGNCLTHLCILAITPEPGAEQGLRKGWTGEPSTLWLYSRVSQVRTRWSGKGNVRIRIMLGQECDIGWEGLGCTVTSVIPVKHREQNGELCGSGVFRSARTHSRARAGLDQRSPKPGRHDSIGNVCEKQGHQDWYRFTLSSCNSLSILLQHF